MPSALPYLPLDSRHGLTGGFFCRHGGVSPTPFATLNLSFGVGDDSAHVRENRRRVKAALGLASLVSARQVHGAEILVIDTPPQADCEYDGYDALITNQPGVGLLIQQADCQAVVLHDPVHQVVANVHAGWRGSVAGIVSQTIRRMTEEFSTEPNSLAATISPSLGPCCAEFIHFRSELPPAFHPFQVTANHFDFWAITSMQLVEAGVLPARITTTATCTRCNSDYFSYRREATTGRAATVAALCPTP